jgi:hypothetical protein
MASRAWIINKANKMRTPHQYFFIKCNSLPVKWLSAVIAATLLSACASSSTSNQTPNSKIHYSTEQNRHQAYSLPAPKTAAEDSDWRHRAPVSKHDIQTRADRSSASYARTQSLQIFQSGLAAYRNGAYERCLTELSQSLHGLTEDEKSQALVFAAAAAYWLNDSREAEELLIRLFRVNPQFDIDPSIFPPEFRDFATRTRSSWR